MIESPVVIPRRTTIALGDDWIIVKAELNAGEMLDCFDASVKADGTIDHRKAGFELMIAYLLEWSFTDPQGGPLRLESPAMTRAALRSFNFATMSRILSAVQTHHGTVQAAQDEKKSDRPIASNPPLPSLAGAAGAMSG